jgi:diguanylate cyclase (GGDEF)-like protein
MAAPGMDNNERQQVREAIAARRPVNVVFRNMRKNGELFWNDLSITPVQDEHGETTHFIGVIMDVTATKQRTAHLEHEVNHDPLTGLANRNLLWDRLEQALHLSQRQKSMVGIVLIDLNNFKNINDSFGHEAGDVVLKVVARRLQASVRDSDTVARLSGDEFVLVLVNQPTLRFTLRMIERLRQGLTQPVSFMHKEIAVGASLGVAVYPHDGITAPDLVRSADVAMYHAKATGRNEIYFFSNDMKSTSEARERLDSGMSHAIERTSCSCCTSPASTRRAAGSPASRPCCAGAIPSTGCCCPPPFSRSRGKRPHRRVRRLGARPGLRLPARPEEAGRDRRAGGGERVGARIRPAGLCREHRLAPESLRSWRRTACRSNCARKP